MQVYWLEQNVADLPADDDWLGAAEAAHLSRLRFAKRRRDWRLGRWTAKHALAQYLNLPSDHSALSAIEIRPAADGAPEAFLANQPGAPSISLSHRAGVAVCGVARPGVALGCDLEVAEPRSEAFTADYFTPAEQAWVAQAAAADRPAMLALLWSAKESVLKAQRVGLRADTRSVAIDPAGLDFPTGENQWRPLRAVHDGRMFHGWWQRSGLLVRTLIGEPAPDSPPRQSPGSRLAS